MFDSVLDTPMKFCKNSTITTQSSECSLLQYLVTATFNTILPAGMLNYSNLLENKNTSSRNNNVFSFFPSLSHNNVNQTYCFKLCSLDCSNEEQANLRQFKR